MDPDHNLVQRALAGDTRCFRTLIERYQDAVFGVALSKAGSVADAEDIAQDTFLAAFQALPTLKQPARFGSWVYGIALNKLKMHLRRGRRHEGANRPPDTSTADAPAPDELAVQEETRAGVMAALGRLSDANRETTTLYYIDGYSQADISHFTRRPLGTIKRRLHEARKQLRKELIAMVEGELKRSRPGRRFTDALARKIGRVRVRRSGGPWDCVLLTDTQGRSLLITSRQEQAEAMDRRLSGQEPPLGPDMYESLLETMGHFACQIKEATIGRLEASAFMATIELMCQDNTREATAGAIDAVNLAMSAGAPIYIENRAVEESMIRRKDGKPMSEASAWRQAGRMAEEQRRQSTPFRDVPELLRALERDPQSPKARRALPALRRGCKPPKVKDTTDGLQKLEEWAQKLKGSDLEAVSTGLLGAVYLLDPPHDLDKATAELEHAHTLAGDDARISFDLATAYAAEGRSEDALSLLEVLAQDPRSEGLRKEVSKCANFQSLWRRKRFCDLFAKPDEDAKYVRFSAQIGMGTVRTRGSKRPRPRQKATPEVLAKAGLKRRDSLGQLLGDVPLLRVEEFLPVPSSSRDQEQDRLGFGLEQKRTITVQVGSPGLHDLSRAAERSRFPGTRPDAHDTFRSILSAVGIKIEGAVLLRAGPRGLECALVTSRDRDTHVTRLHGHGPLAVTLWAKAPLFVAEKLAEKLSVTHEGGSPN